LPGGLAAERTARELQLSNHSEPTPRGGSAEAPPYDRPIPGEIDAPAFGMRLRIELAGKKTAETSPPKMRSDGDSASVPRVATLRNWRPGDRVRLRYSGGLRKVKEVLERLRVTGSARALWPVLEVEGRIVWMKGVEVEPEADLVIRVDFTDQAAVERGQQSATSPK
jgi:tRNA(Ile)-lysidine synthase